MSTEKKNTAEESRVTINKTLEETIHTIASDLDTVTEKLEETEKRLWKTEQLLRGVIDNSSAAVFVKDISGKYLLVNKRFEKYLGITNESVKGKTVFDLFPEEIATTLSCNEPGIISSGVGDTAEVRIPLGDGYTIMLINKFPLFDESNRIFALCGVASDITEIQSSKEQQEILSTELHKKNQQLLSFAHITSHNLRAPVSNLNSLLWLYKESETSDEKALLFEKFETVIHHLSETLNSLVDSLKIQEDMRKEREQLSFEEVFKKIRASLAGKILKTEAVVSGNFTKAPKIEYPKIYLESILLNLLSNALKYRSPNRIPVIHAETGLENGVLLLRFSDNGLGIDLKRHGEKIFGLNKTFHRHVEAKGVGLFITKTQVEAMGGDISVESEPGKGAVFTIRFNKIRQ